LSGQFLQRSSFAAVDAIVGAVVTSHTHRNVTNQPKYGQIINCALTILIVAVFLCCLRISTKLRPGAVDKMAGIFENTFGNLTYVNQTNLNGKLRKNWGGQAKI